jgi:exodeoxyribonuclease-3
MKIATWNVNSIKVRLPQLLDWLEQQRPDIMGLQETKTIDANFPAGEIEAAGYRVVFSGQKTYNGVAIVSKEPIAESVTEIPGLEDPQRRVLFAMCGGVRVMNVYVPNGQEVGSEKFAYKLKWLERLTEYVKAQIKAHDKVVLLGDFNITPDDRDVHDPEAWREQILCSTPERDALKRIFECGLDDSFRLFDQPEKVFSWWDYRASGFRRNAGLRLDLILTAKALSAKCTASYVDTAPRMLERPSDHAPAVAEFH